MAEKIDSNLTGLAIAEESSLKTLPASPVWLGMEPNSYSDFGAEVTTVARSPINASRQKQKGTVTDLDASGGCNIDFTQNSSQSVLQGFFFADIREKFSTSPINGTKIAITSVTGANQFAAASGLTGFKVNSLVLASGFGVATTNGLAKVTAAVSGLLTVSKTLTAEAAPPATATIETVGFEFPAGDLSITASASSIRLLSAATDLTTLGLTVGEWVFIGGDATANQFALNVPGYGRIAAITATYIDFSETTFTATTDAGTGKSVRMFFGRVLRNEKDTALIKRRSYQMERQLGDDGVGTQSEYLLGAIANEFTLNIPQADKLNADLTFVAMDVEARTGTQGLKAGTRVNPTGEAAYNTSSDVYRLRLNIVDPLNLNNAALFGYMTEASIAINNNVTPAKAIGVVGAFDATAGDFEVTGSVTAYFSNVTAVQAVRNNADVAMNMIAAQDNKGFTLDIPLLSLGGGRINVEKDAAITIPLDTNAAECAAGYTLLATFFQYLPNVGMPS